MIRGVALAVVGLAAAMVLTAAAAAQPVRLWVVPASGTGSPSVDVPPPAVIDSPRPPPARRSARGRDLGPLLQVLAVGVVGAGISVLVAMRGWWSVEGPSRRPRIRRGRRFAALPDVATIDVAVGLAEARDALSRGKPRNAIVACWMRLERDIAAAGWPRRGAETSAEYVERIVAEASVDPFAISDLAALYREARFSDHELPDAHRTRALEALTRVEAGLRTAVWVSS